MALPSWSEVAKPSAILCRRTKTALPFATALACNMLEQRKTAESTYANVAVAMPVVPFRRSEDNGGLRAVIVDSDARFAFVLQTVLEIAVEAPADELAQSAFRDFGEVDVGAAVNRFADGLFAGHLACGAKDHASFGGSPRERGRGRSRATLLRLQE